MSKVSILIPSRNEPFLQQTVDDVLRNATGEIEVLVVVDGGNDRLTTSDPRVIRLTNSKPFGTRVCINTAVSMATGTHLLKLDAHCMVSQGFDEVLVAGDAAGRVATLPRYSLNPEKWERGYGPICYEYLEYPFREGHPVGGLTPKKWLGERGDSGMLKSAEYYWMERAREKYVIDPIMTMNGACWFMERDFYHDIGGLDERLWSFHNDAVEITMKAWMRGGGLVVNKGGWHAHWWKSERKRTVALNWDAMRNTQAWQTWYWTHDRWPLARRTFDYFVERFWPIPTWPESWREDVAALEEPVLKRAFA